MRSDSKEDRSVRAAGIKDGLQCPQVRHRESCIFETEIEDSPVRKDLLHHGGGHREVCPGVAPDDHVGAMPPTQLRRPEGGRAHPGDASPPGGSDEQEGTEPQDHGPQGAIAKKGGAEGLIGSRMLA